MQPHSICIRLLFVISVVGATKPPCPGNTFRCQDDSCIPIHWTCDLEPDCDSGSDEWPLNTKCLPTSTTVATTVTTTTKKSPRRPALMVSHRVTTTTTVPTTADDYRPGWEGEDAESLRQMELSVCTAENRTTVERCTQKLAIIMSQFANMDGNRPMFTDASQKNLQLLRSSCSMFEDFHQCMGDLWTNPKNCISNATLELWDRLRTFSCQLILPASQDAVHQQCFTAIFSPPCLTSLPTISGEQRLPSVCHLLSSMHRQVQCFDGALIDRCGDASRDVIMAIRHELDGFQMHYKCDSALVHPTTAPQTAGAGGVGENQQLASSNTGTSQCASPEDMGNCIDHIVELSKLGNIFGGNNTADGMMKMCAAVNRFKACARSIPGSGCWLTRGPINAISTMTNVVCKDEVLLGIPKYSSCMSTAEKNPELIQCMAKKPLDNINAEPKPCGILYHMETFLKCMIPLTGGCPEGGREYVEMLREKVVDEEIILECENPEDAAFTPAPDGECSFALKPVAPPCTLAQNSAGIECLTVLASLISLMPELTQKDILIEASSANSTLMTKVCTTHSEYAGCMKQKVYLETGGQKCAPNSALSSIATIGLKPLCDPATRNSFNENRWCIKKLSAAGRLRHCSVKINHLSSIITDMFSGGGARSLCKLYYLIKDEIFACLEPAVSEECGEKALADLNIVKTKMTKLGVQEGCPAEKPDNFDECERLSKTTTLPPTTATKKATTPLAQLDGRASTSNVDVAVPTTVKPTCAPEQKTELLQCARPLFSLNPHPITAIKRVRQIDHACAVLQNYTDCASNIQCQHPATMNMVATMIGYACSHNNLQTYTKVRRCLRKISSRKDVLACVDAFNKASSTPICDNTNSLYGCIESVLKEKCEEEENTFVLGLLNALSTSVDSSCVVGTSTSVSCEEKTDDLVAALPLGRCNGEQCSGLQECRKPMDAIVEKLKTLFAGGLQSFIANAQKLGPIFADGCELVDPYKDCIRPHVTSSCQVSSCLIQAGDGICNETDKGAAINKHLSCVFSLIATPTFGRCIRIHIAPLGQLTIDKIKTVLPDLISCIETPILNKCGQTPLRVMRALAESGTKCILNLDETISKAPPLPEPEQTAPTTATGPSIHPSCVQQLSVQAKCHAEHLSKHMFYSIALLPPTTDITIACNDYHAHSACMRDAAASGCQLKRMPVANLLAVICNNTLRDSIQQHRVCLSDVARTPQAQHCIQKYYTGSARPMCDRLSETHECASAMVQENCGEPSLDLVYSALGAYARQLEGGDNCNPRKEFVALSTGCTIREVGDYLDCSVHMDTYAPSPLFLIDDPLKIDEFCENLNNTYLPCAQKLTCPPEPMTSASTNFYMLLCQRKDEYKREAQCLHRIRNGVGASCLQTYVNSVDYLNRNAHGSVCNMTNQLIRCAGPSIFQQCGLDTIRFAFEMNQAFMFVFDQECLLYPPELPPTPEPTPTLINLTQSVDIAANAEPKPGTRPEPTPVQATAEPKPEPESSKITESSSTTSTAEPTPEAERTATSTTTTTSTTTAIKTTTSDGTTATDAPVPEPSTTPRPVPELEPKPTRTTSATTLHTLPTKKTTVNEPEKSVKKSGSPPVGSGAVHSTVSAVSLVFVVLPSVVAAWTSLSRL